MRDLLPEWIADYERFQETSPEMSAEIDLMLEERPNSPNMKDILEIREFLADRYNMMQDEIDRLQAMSASGSQVLLMSKEERDGWDARVEAEELERARE